MHASTDVRERDPLALDDSSPLTSSEALLWSIERDPALRSTIMAVAVLDGHVDVDRLHERIVQAARAFPRLHQRVTRTRRGVLCWSDVPDWDVDQHFTHLRVPAPGSMRHVLDIAGEQAGEAFDPARPLWHLTLFDGVEGDRSALVVKMHHAMTDGIGGVGLTGLFTDAEPHPQSPPAMAPRHGPPPHRRGRANMLSVANSIMGSAIRDPFAALRSAPTTAKSTVKILAPAIHPLSPLTTGRGLDRHLEVLDVPLLDLERAGHAVAGTVNDAFMAAIVGGLRRYHEAHGETPSELRVTMPISVRREGDEPGGNRFTPARFTVPLSIDDPARRMEELGRIARQWRHEPAVGMTDVLAGALTRLPDAVTTSVFGSMLKGVDFVATNVPGSRERCFLAGAEVLRFYGFGPPSGSAMSVALVSHIETCCVGINVDTAAIDDPDLLRRSLEQGFAEVAAIGRGGRRRRRTSATAESSANLTMRAPATAPRRLSALDASFLEAETASTPMHVGALIMLAGDPLRDARGQLRLDEIRAAIASQLPRSPRMRQLAVPVPFARPVWEDSPTFDIAQHVRHVRIPDPGTRAELEALCCELQMQVLDRSKPLWEMWFVDGLVDGSVGLVYKVHHAVVDGVSAAETFEVLLGARNSVATAPASRANDRAQRVMDAVIDGAGTTARLCLETGVLLATDPARSVATAMGLGRLVRPSAIAPHTTLNQPVGDSRRLVSVSFDLAEAKAVAHRYDASVNDLVLTLVGAGLNELFESRGERVAHVQALVPISLRGDTEHDGLGNRVGAMLVPIGLERDPTAALAAITSATRSRKAGPEAVALDFLLRSSDAWPVVLLGPASRRIVHHQPFVNLVVTNVRGAQHPLSLLGSQITEIIPVVPLGGNLTLGVAALSYAGRLVLGLHADADACPDVDLMAQGIERAYRDLGQPMTRHAGGRRLA